MPNEIDLNDPYDVVMKDNLGELINAVNLRLRSGNWTLVGGIETAERTTRDGQAMVYLQAMVLKSFHS